MPLDELQKQFFDVIFDRDFMAKRGEEFQNWFAEIAGHAYGVGFEAVRPYGKKGDLKCDGFMPHEGIVFQCYAPYSMTESKLISKIAKDFVGASIKWRGIIKKWVLVHNDERGLSGHTVQFMESLRAKFSGIEIETWAKEALYDIVVQLEIHKIEKIFGSLPALETMSAIGYQDITLVLDSIEGQSLTFSDEVIAPSQEKLEKNMLSTSVTTLLKSGRRIEHVVENIFDHSSQPDFGEGIGTAIRKKYCALKELNLPPDKIFEHLQKFVGFNGSPKRQVAALAVLSYFFERCDIFEDP